MNFPDEVPWYEKEPLHAYIEVKAPTLEVDIVDNPVVAELLDAGGNVIRQWLARRPIGYR